MQKVLHAVSSWCYYNDTQERYVIISKVDTPPYLDDFHFEARGA